MRIVIIGAKGRDGAEDKTFVYQLIEAAAEKYPFCTFVTMMSNVGVGAFVKEKCLEKTAGGAPKYVLIDCSVRIYGINAFSRSEQSAVFLARNATLFEMGDMFYYLASQDRRGTVEELIADRVAPAGRPYKVFLPGDMLELL